MAAPKDPRFKLVAENRKARFNYEIGEKFEAGIALTGSEVKSLRSGKAAIAESYADARRGEIWLINSNITEYLQAGRFNHAPKRAIEADRKSTRLNSSHTVISYAVFC